MNYKKVIIPSIVAIIAVSVWAFTPVALHEIHSLTTDFTMDEILQYSDLVIIATYDSQRTEETWVDGFPLRQVTTVNVLDVLKGSYNESTLEMFDDGEGASYQKGYRTEVVNYGYPPISYQPNEKMIMFLEHSVLNEKGEVNVLGEGYYLIANRQGMYTINGVNATHIYEDRSTTVQNIRDMVK